MDDLERKRFLQCLKTDTEDIEISKFTFWTPGNMLFGAYKEDYEGIKSKDRGKL